MIEIDEPGYSDNEALPDINPKDKWSIIDDPSRTESSRVKRIDIYDFDGTLFKSPKPNTALWDRSSVNLLTAARAINNSSWWQQVSFLKECGEGYYVEKGRNWRDLWVDHILRSAQDSINDTSTISILLTARKANTFKDQLLEILNAKGLHFNCVILKKGEIRNSSKYKKQVIGDFIKFYPNIEYLEIWDDRYDQLKMLREYLNQLRPHFKYYINNIKPLESKLIRSKEIEIVENWILSHNHNYNTGRVKTLGILKLVKTEGTYQILKESK